MPTIGQKLQERRLDLGLEIEDVAHDTHIQASMLAGIEQDDFSRFPSVSYAKSFIRQYGERLGLNLEEALESLEGHSKLGEGGNMFPAESRFRRFRLRWPRRWTKSLNPFAKRKKRAPWILNLLILALASAILVFYMIGYDAASPEQAKEEIVRQLTRPIAFEGADRPKPTDQPAPTPLANPNQSPNQSPNQAPAVSEQAPGVAAEKASFIPKSLVEPMIEQAAHESAGASRASNDGNSPLRPRVTPGVDLGKELPSIPASPTLPSGVDSPSESIEIRPPGTDPAEGASKNSLPASGKPADQPTAPVLRAVPVVISE